MSADAPELDLSGGLWLSVSGIAEHLGISRQAVSKRAKELEASGAITMRDGAGGTKEINLAQYLVATKNLGDPAREMGVDTRRDASDDAVSNDPTFRDAAAREKRFRADLAEIAVKEKLRELVDVTSLAAAVAQAGEVILAVLERAPQQADAIATAVARDGAAGVRTHLKAQVRVQRSAIADALRKMVADISGDDAAKAVRFAADAGTVLWGDLDPAEWAGSDHASISQNGA